MHGTNYLIQQRKSVASQKNLFLLEKNRRKQSTSLQPIITKRKRMGKAQTYHGSEHPESDISREKEQNIEAYLLYVPDFSCLRMNPCENVASRGLVETILHLLERSSIRFKSNNVILNKIMYKIMFKNIKILTFLKFE